MSMYGSKNIKSPKNYEYWSSLVSEMSSELLGVRSCGECGGGGDEGGEGYAPNNEPPFCICSK